MLGVSGLMGSPVDGASGGSSEAGAASSSVPGGGAEESVGGGNRWPRQETVALLKIRSDMESTFRESSLKGPLWEEISRKMGELGYQRSSKKCKEKFENVYKYHKRTKDGRATKSDGKTYRFFDQLEAFEAAPPPPPPTMLPSTGSPNPVSVAPPAQVSNQPSHPAFRPPPNPPQIQHMFEPQAPGSLLSNSTSTSSTSSDEDVQRRRGRKRKWKEFFERLMKDVVHKQEELQNKFLDALERRERDRMAREDAWRAQETARLNREHELLVQERSNAASKDAAVISFLQKVTEQPSLKINPQPQVTAPPQTILIPTLPTPQATPPPNPLAVATPITKMSPDSGGCENSSASSSRWPKAEVEALINLRTSLDLKYQDNGPKGPLWEEISSAMAKIGYNRSSKRCKEKWENINKYFKKVKESNKRRPEDSKTCPYFHQLDALYRDKAIRNDVVSISFSTAGSTNYGGTNINTNMAPIMARPEQQWPLAPDHPQQHQQQQQQQPQNTAMPDNEDDDEDDYDDEDEDPDDEGGGFEIVANNQPSSVRNPAVNFEGGEKTNLQ